MRDRQIVRYLLSTLLVAGPLQTLCSLPPEPLSPAQLLVHVPECLVLSRLFGHFRLLEINAISRVVHRVRECRDKVAHVPLAVVLFHWNGLDTSREEAILAEVDRNLAFCFGKDEAFVGRVDAWNYAIVHATETLRNDLQITLTGASFQVLVRETRQLAPDGPATQHWASVISLQLGHAFTAAATLERVAKEEWAKLRGLSDDEVCSGALSRLAPLQSEEEYLEFVTVNDVAVVATMPAGQQLAADRLELVSACDVAPGVRCGLSAAAEVAEAAGAHATQPDVRVYIRGKFRHAFNGLDRADLRVWMGELGLSPLIRVTADTLDSLIMGPLPVVLVSLSSNPVMDLPDFGSEWVLSPVAPNGSYVMAAGGRTLEDIVRTVAADFTESVRFAYYLENELPFLGDALGVEFDTPGQPLFSWEQKGRARFFFPHPLKPMRRAAELFRRFVKNSLQSALPAAPAAREGWERRLLAGLVNAVPVPIGSAHELAEVYADRSADLFLLVQWMDSTVHKIQRSFTKAVESLPEDPLVKFAIYLHAGRLTEDLPPAVRHVLAEGASAAVVHRSPAASLGDVVFDDWRVRDGVVGAATRLGGWVRNRLDVSGEASASVGPAVLAADPDEGETDPLTAAEEQEWAAVLGRIDRAARGENELCRRGATIPVPQWRDAAQLLVEVGTNGAAGGAGGGVDFSRGGGAEEEGGGPNDSTKRGRGTSAAGGSTTMMDRGGAAATQRTRRDE